MTTDLRNKTDCFQELGGDGSRVAIYLRVSTTRQAKDGVSLDVQRDKFKEMKRHFGPSQVYEYVDPGKSGREFANRKIATILGLARKKKIDELWVTHIDRIGRNLLDLLYFFVILWKNDVLIRTPEDSYTNKHLSKLLDIILKAYMAEESNVKRTELSVDSKRRNFKSGKWNKATPLGYKKKRWLEKISEWAPIIKGCYSLFIPNNSVASVCRRINRRHIQFLAKPLSRYQIKRILSDSVYIGEPAHMGVVVFDPSLAFVDEEMFARSKEILRRKLSRHKPDRVDPIKALVVEYGVSALEFMDNLEYYHKGCGGLLVKNGTRIVDGVRRQTFVCKKCGEQFWVPSNSQLSHIQNPTANMSIHPLIYCSPSLKRSGEDRSVSVKQAERKTKDMQASLSSFS